MKILYLADFAKQKSKMHKVSWLKLEALQHHPDFVCVNAHPVEFSTLGKERLSDLIRQHQPDVVVHDAMWGVPAMLASWDVSDIPRILMVEDFNPFVNNIAAFQRMKHFDHFVTIPLVAQRSLPNATWIGHHIPDWFNDYGLEKDIDVFFYGQQSSVLDGKEVYPFRKRLVELFVKQDLRFFAAPQRTWNYTGSEYVGEHLARTINRAHLTISCTTAHNYMVKKYLEVPACKSTVLGDINDECRLVYPNDEGILVVSPEDSDDEIVNRVFKFLENPKPSQEAFDIARGRNPDAYAKKLREICEKVLEDDWI